MNLGISNGVTNVSVSSAIQELREALAPAGPKRPVPASVLGIGRRADTPDLVQELCTIVHKAFEDPAGIHERPGALDFRSIETLARCSAGRDDVSVHLRDVLEYLALYGIVAGYFKRQGWDRQFLSHASWIQEFFTREHAEQLLDGIYRSGAYREGSFAARMLNGLVLSTFDRRAAEESFQLARAANSELWAHRRLDVGAASYLSGESVRACEPDANDCRRHLEGSLTFLTPMRRWEPGSYMYVCGCDLTYFRAYFPQWLNLAEYFKARRMAFHFLLCASGSEAADAVEVAEALRRQFGLLRHAPRTYADNISFSSIPVPDQPGDPNVFYTCARFLLARRIGHEYRGPVLVHDIDMFFREDPGPYLHALDLERVSVQVGQASLAKVKPWRRVLAGTLVLPYSQRPHDSLAPLEDYLLATLPTGRWMSDQNGLTYFVEQAIDRGEADAAISVLGGPRHVQPFRPTAGEGIRRLMEGGQRGLEEADR